MPQMRYPNTTEITPIIRSEGQRMFLHVEGSLDAIAREVGAKGKQSISEWRSGRKIPSIEMRARIQSAFGIPAGAWSKRPAGADGVEATSVQTQEAEALPSTLDDCLALLAVIRRDRKQDGLLAAERVKLSDAEARILALRARLESAHELAEDRYVRDHPAWKRIERLLAEALEPFPEAAKAVHAALLRALREVEQ